MKFRVFVKIFISYVQRIVSMLKNLIKNRAGKIRFSGARKSVLLKASSGERCAPQNVVHLVTFRDTRVHLILWKDESAQ